MLEIYSDIFMFRGAERLLIIIGGMIFAYLGYRLFLFGADEGNGKLETESALFKLTFSGSGPGLFFMAFGALILINGMLSSASIERETLLADKLSESASTGTGEVHKATPGALKATAKYAGEETEAELLINMQIDYGHSLGYADFLGTSVVTHNLPECTEMQHPDVRAKDVCALVSGFAT